MSEGEGWAKPKKPGMAAIKYKGSEIFIWGYVEGSGAHGEFAIWEGDEFIQAGKVGAPPGRLDYATASGERAAREWIDTQEAAN